MCKTIKPQINPQNKLSDEMGGTCGTCEGELYTGFFVGDPEENRPLLRRRLRCEDKTRVAV